jgi:hypothetical protein
MQPSLIAVLPCNDLDRTEAFFVRLGFKREESSRACPNIYKSLDSLARKLYLHRNEPTSCIPIGARSFERASLPDALSALVKSG